MKNWMLIFFISTMGNAVLATSAKKNDAKPAKSSAKYEWYVRHIDPNFYRKNKKIRYQRHQVPTADFCKDVISHTKAIARCKEIKTEVNTQAFVVCQNMGSLKKKLSCLDFVVTADFQSEALYNCAHKKQDEVSTLSCLREIANKDYGSAVDQCWGKVGRPLEKCLAKLPSTPLRLPGNRGVIQEKKASSAPAQH